MKIMEVVNIQNNTRKRIFDFVKDIVFGRSKRIKVCELFSCALMIRS